MILTIAQEKIEQFLAEKYWAGFIHGLIVGAIVMFLICL